jgi:hypothetical protein
MIKNIPKSDIAIRPFMVYKDWVLNQSDLDVMYGISLETDLYDEGLDILNDNGTSKYMLYDTINMQFYANPITSYADDIDNTIGIISIPQIKYGEGIRPNSVQLTYGSVFLEDDGNSNLVESGSDEYKGNVFYDRGLIVITDGIVDNSSLTIFELSYQSTMTIYENEIFISVLENEFNVSQNSTGLINVTGSYVHIEKTNPYTNQSFTASYFNLESAEINSDFLDYDYNTSNDITGSYLAPFITTIGLYDDDLNMVAVAKLPNPIKKFPDYPINFIIRIDT